MGLNHAATGVVHEKRRVRGVLHALHMCSVPMRKGRLDRSIAIPTSSGRSPPVRTGGKPSLVFPEVTHQLETPKDQWLLGLKRQVRTLRFSNGLHLRRPFSNKAKVA